MIRFLFVCFGFVFIISSPAMAQDSQPERSLVDDLLECSVFYETHGALKARSNRPSQELWDKADSFKRKGIEKAKTTQSLSEQEINTRINYLVKKWAKRLLSVNRLNHQQKQDLRLWTQFCDKLGDMENIVPLNY